MASKEEEGRSPEDLLDSTLRLQSEVDELVRAVSAVALDSTSDDAKTLRDALKAVVDRAKQQLDISKAIAGEEGCKPFSESDACALEVLLAAEVGTPQNDNSVISLHPKKIGELGFYFGDTMQIRTKEGKETVCILLADETCQENGIIVNTVTCSNLRVREGDFVQLSPVTCKYGEKVCILPYESTFKELEGVDLFKVFLKPYFLDAYRPVVKGDVFSVHEGGRKAEFKIVDVSPERSCIVASETVIYCEGGVVMPDGSTKKL
mmetsp:Transcript_32686/g.91526  ORF Transcript_32686/g.91526 Transcript_32686/m.91526 type:complete len:263 (-) Transcript_32686:86-874(-)|eukprot:CAMPEP_0119134752 /NCGR_PEP_ID=MMETSP1310-20130426/17727_1 /TAXON_ID=464262 /ORGANISM="Genus nov. species nov., Strain RCC2339" /LENGTH=262 /DNA_ID=CAMNT_0007125579 /DNA_START=47 /DNA_END=835 /DNA_ORIENTATION=-